MGKAVYKGALPAANFPSEKLGVNLLFNKGVETEVQDIDLLQRLEGSSDFEVKYTTSEVVKIVAGKSVSELKKWLARSGVSDSRDLSTKREVIDALKKVKTKE